VSRRRTPRLLAITLAVLALGACGESVVERSFTDKHGRVCTYVMVKEANGGKDVQNLSCEYPRTPPPSP
jgi:hypothetical protein